MSGTPTNEHELRNYLIEQLIGVAMVIGVIYLQRKLSDPDAFRTLRMRGALAVKHFADEQAHDWQTISAHAATAYNKARV